MEVQSLSPSTCSFENISHILPQVCVRVFVCVRVGGGTGEHIALTHCSSSTGDLHEEIANLAAPRERDAFEDDEKMHEAVFAEIGFDPLSVPLWCLSCFLPLLTCVFICRSWDARHSTWQNTEREGAPGRRPLY